MTMKWFLLVHKATRRYLYSQQFHLHEGSNCCSGYQYFHASHSTEWSKSIKIHRMQSLNSSQRYSTSTSEFTRSFMNDTKSEIYTKKKVPLEIISRETIKPVSPTPHHLRIFNLSLIDQIMLDDYIPLILFIPNSDEASIIHVISKRLKHLKETLSQILCQFYPLAGEIKDKLHIECNDKGVSYIQARINQTLEKFLFDVDVEKMRELMPESPRFNDSAIGNYPIRIQINVFNCGGIGLGMRMAHKIMDFHSCTIFIKAWAATAKGSPKTISPSFVAIEVFPNDPTQEYSIPVELRSSDLLITKRFVFDPSSLSLLMKQVVNTQPLPSRMEATTAVIWKAITEATSTIKRFDPQSPHTLVIPINLRNRASPVFIENSIGNIVMPAKAICYPDSKPNLATLIGILRESIGTINKDYIESLKGEKGHEIVNKMLKELNLTTVGEHITFSSLLNSGIYDLDFGWGKPIWFSIVTQRSEKHVMLNDTQKGDGVEATVTLSRDEMEIFERDNELLSYATVNTCPLQFLS